MQVQELLSVLKSKTEDLKSKIKGVNYRDPKTILIIVGIVIACVAAWYWFGPGVGSGTIKDLKPAVDGVRTNLQSAGQYNDAAIGELDRSQQATRDLESLNQQLADTSARLREAQQRLEATSNQLSAANEELERLASEGKAGSDRNKERIERGKRILQQIRETNQGKN